MRKEVVRAVELVVLGLMMFLASCQSGGTVSSRAQITDPNTAFSQGGARANVGSAPVSGASSRRGGLFQGPDADSQSR